MNYLSLRRDVNRIFEIVVRSRFEATGWQSGSFDAFYSILAFLTDAAAFSSNVYFFDLWTTKALTDDSCQTVV